MGGKTGFKVKAAERREGEEESKCSNNESEGGGEFLPTFFTSCLKDFTNRNDQTTKTPREDTGTILLQKEKTPKSLALYGTHN